VDVVALSAKLAYSPAEHAIALHDEEPANEYVPAVHKEHDVASAPADYVPAEQEKHPLIVVVAESGKLAY